MRKLEIIGLAVVAATAFGVWSADTVANSRAGKAGDFFGCMGVGSLDRPQHLAVFAHEHDPPAALHPAGELGGAVFLAGAAGRHGENIAPTLPRIESDRIAGMADYTHTIDRRDSRGCKPLGSSIWPAQVWWNDSSPVTFVI
jgi:hypothetical protein